MEIIRLLVFCLAAVILYKVVKSDRKKEREIPLRFTFLSKLCPKKRYDYGKYNYGDCQGFIEVFNLNNMETLGILQKRRST